MRGRYPCGGIHRREFLSAAAVSILGASTVSGQQPEDVAPRSGPRDAGRPGPYPGRVIEVRNPALKRDGGGDREAVRATLNRGLSP